MYDKVDDDDDDGDDYDDDDDDDDDAEIRKLGSLMDNGWLGTIEIFNEFRKIIGYKTNNNWDIYIYMAKNITYLDLQWF